VILGPKKLPEAGRSLDEEARNDPFPGATKEEVAILDALKGHEFAHGEFFKEVLGDNAIPALEPDFSAVDFTNRDSVLQTASTFENLGVSASEPGPLRARYGRAQGRSASARSRRSSKR